MAKFQPSELITGISAKIGGTSLSKQKQYNTMRNITQSNKNATVKQSIKRLKTATISAEWRNLTQLQRDSYATEAPFYTFKTPFGVDKSRTPYGLFMYLSENLSLSGLKAPFTAPPFVSVVQPVIDVISANESELIISANNTNPNYLYFLFAVANLPPGQKGDPKAERLCGSITPAQLDNGTNILPQILDVFKNPPFTKFLSFRLATVHQVTGNRTLNPEMIQIDLTTPEPFTTIISTHIGFTLESTFYCANNGNFYFHQRATSRLQRLSLPTPYILEPNSSNLNGNLFRTVIVGTFMQTDGSFRIIYRVSGGNGILEKLTPINPFDINTETVTQSVTMLPTDFQMGIFCKTDGSKLGIKANGIIYMYEMNIPFDLTTLNLLNSAPLFGASSAIGWTMSQDGLNIYNYSGTKVTQYALSIAYDLNTVSSTKKYEIDLNTVLSLPGANFNNPHFSNDGKYLYLPRYVTVSNRISAIVCVLNVPWDLGNIVIL